MEEKDEEKDKQEGRENVVEDFQISRMVRSTEFSMAQSHYHAFYELYYLLSGHCRMFVGHKLYYVEAGDMLLFAPGVLHRATYPEGSGGERIAVSFSASVLDPLLKAGGGETLASLFDNTQLWIPIPVRPQVELLFDKIEEEMREGGSLAVFLAKNHFYEMLVAAGRYGVCQKQGAMGETENAIQEAARYISQNYEKPLSLEDMARMVHMTPTYFSRRFKQVTGFGFKEYVVYTRIAQAEKLLAHTRLPVTEIGVVCGFEDGNYFGDCFRKHKGISPREYRRRTGDIAIT